MEIKKAIEKVCEGQRRSVLEYFKVMKEHNCLDRIDEREQFIMKMMPIVFKNRLLKLLEEK